MLTLEHPRHVPTRGPSRAGSQPAHRCLRVKHRYPLPLPVLLRSFFPGQRKRHKLQQPHWGRGEESGDRLTERTGSPATPQASPPDGSEPPPDMHFRTGLTLKALRQHQHLRRSTLVRRVGATVRPRRSKPTASGQRPGQTGIPSPERSPDRPNRARRTSTEKWVPSRDPGLPDRTRPKIPLGMRFRAV